MADLEVKLDPNDVNRIQRLLSYVPKAIPQVFSTALNKTAVTARKESAQKISKESGIKVNMVRKMIRMIPATRARWMAVLRVSSKKLPAIKFFKARVRAGEKEYTKPTGIEIPDSAFLQTMPSGHFGLFERVGLKRLPIREIFGPSLGEIFSGSSGIVNEVHRNASANLARNVEGQVRRVLSKGG